MYTFNELLKLEDREHLIGKKAESLIKLIEGGFNVPDGFVITTNELDSYAEEELEKHLTGNASWAVRSSGLNEDLENASFAGQYDSFLNVRTVGGVVEAINKCAASVQNERVINYCKHNSIPLEDCRMSVIVQHMVDSKKSGVAFSIDSVNGFDKEIIIEAVSGLGEVLVSGQVTPDYYSYHWYDDRFTTYNGGILSENEVKDLSKIILDIQTMYGFPVDVEWAIANNEMYILQSRPITAITYKGIPHEWTTADFRDGGVSSTVCKPLMASLYGSVFYDSFSKSLKDIKLFNKNDNIPLYDVFFSRPYWNLTESKRGLAKLPGFIEREHDEDLGVGIAYKGDGMITKTSFKSLFNGIKTLSAISKHLKTMYALCDERKFNFLKKFEEIDKIDLNKKSAEELHSLWENIVCHEYHLSETTYFAYIFCNVIIQPLFKDKMKKYLMPNEIINLMIGLDDISHMRPIYEMWEISREKFNEYRFREFIQKYKHHSLHELDISYPNYDEQPDVVREMIRNFTKLEDNQNPKTLGEQQRNKYLLTHKKVPHKLHKYIDEMREFLWWREEFRDISTKYYYAIRKVSNVLGEAWCKNGYLENADDIYFLKINDIVHGDLQVLKNIVVKNKQYYNSFRNFANPNELGNRFIAEKQKIGGNEILKGVPCSGETITGIARVIADIHDTNRLKQGDILIARCTDPAWTSVFSKISGVVTETGGLLSHAAVVSREYGIACILVVKNATKIIKDGDEITLDCKTGQIYKNLKK